MVNYIRNRAPDFASKQEVAPGVPMWYLTAGTGVVPNWVSIIGLLSFAFLLAIPLEFGFMLFRYLAG